MLSIYIYIIRLQQQQHTHILECASPNDKTEFHLKRGSDVIRHALESELFPLS